MPRRFWLYVARRQPALQQKCTQPHLLIWWAVVCVTHTQTDIEKFLVLWNCFGTDYTCVALVLACVRVFGASCCAFSERCLVCALLQNFSSEVTGHWNDTEKICMTRVRNDMYTVIQTRCRCRTSLERTVCTTPRPTVMLSARVFKEKVPS